VAASPQHDGLLKAGERRRREELATLQGSLNEAKRRGGDGAQGEHLSFLGVDFGRVRSRQGAWRAWYPPRRKKRPALGRKLKAILRRSPSPPMARVSQLSNPIRRGWGREFAGGEASRGVGFVKDWGEKKGRRPLRRARNRKGCGWKRGRKQGRYQRLGVCNNYRGQRPRLTARPAREVAYPSACSEQESAVRDNRPLRLTWRGLETWPRWNCAPMPQSKERNWNPSTSSRRACPRPYRREGRAARPFPTPAAERQRSGQRRDKPAQW
jgi:Group II intron, maturase-specific domain